MGYVPPRMEAFTCTGGFFLCCLELKSAAASRCRLLRQGLPPTVDNQTALPVQLLLVENRFAFLSLASEAL